MNGALDALRTAVAEQLRQAGVNAVTAMEGARAGRRRGAVAAVSLSRVACVPGGFQDYLGRRADPKTGKERELYGRKAELTLALDIYAPRDGGERACPSWSWRRAGWNFWNGRGCTVSRCPAGAGRGWWPGRTRAAGPSRTLK